MIGPFFRNISKKVDWLLHPKNKWQRAFKILNISLTVAVLFMNLKIRDQDNAILEQRTIINKQSVQIADLEREIMQKTIDSYEFNALIQSSNDSPVPQWSKKVQQGPEGRKYVMRFFNKAYAEIFLLPRGIDPSIYLGQEDYVVWDSTTVKEFIRRDSLVFSTKRPFRGKIQLPDSTGKMQEWRINKYPVFFDGEPIFISGIAFKDQMK